MVPVEGGVEYYRLAGGAVEFGVRAVLRADTGETLTFTADRLEIRDTTGATRAYDADGKPLDADGQPLEAAGGCEGRGGQLSALLCWLAGVARVVRTSAPPRPSPQGAA